MKTESKSQERVFSVELKSKSHLKNINMTNGGSDSFFIEGTLGQLQHAWFEEGIILEIVGQNGVLRINLEEHEIQKKQLNSEATTQ
jgi:hypothetical protein